MPDGCSRRQPAAGRGVIARRLSQRASRNTGLSRVWRRQSMSSSWLVLMLCRGRSSSLARVGVDSGQVVHVNRLYAVPGVEKQRDRTGLQAVCENRGWSGQSGWCAGFRG